MMTDRRKRLTLLMAIAAVAAVVALPGCGGGSHSSSTGSGGETSNSRSYQGTQSPGDPWHWTITTAGSTWTASNSTTGYTYSGTWSLLSSGFEELTVTQTTDPNVTVPTPLYGLEVPNTMFIAKPVGANTNPIIAASLGASPTAAASLDFNYVHIPEQGYVPDTGDAYGTVNFGVANNVWTGTVTQFNIHGTAITPDLDLTLTDSNGLLTGGSSVTDTTVKGGITSSGVAILDLGPGKGGAVGVQQATSPVDINAVAAGNYLGVHVNPTDGAFLVYGTGGTGGQIAIGRYSNVKTGAQLPNYGTITFTAQPSPGQLTATVNYTSGGSAPAVFVVNQVNGKYILFGIVKHPLGTAHFTLVQQ